QTGRKGAGTSSTGQSKQNSSRTNTTMADPKGSDAGTKTAAIVIRPLREDSGSQSQAGLDEEDNDRSGADDGGKEPFITASDISTDSASEGVGKQLLFAQPKLADLMAKETVSAKPDGKPDPSGQGYLGSLDTSVPGQAAAPGDNSPVHGWVADGARPGDAVYLDLERSARLTGVNQETVAALDSSSRIAKPESVAVSVQELADKTAALHFSAEVDRTNGLVAKEAEAPVKDTGFRDIVRAAADDYTPAQPVETSNPEVREVDASASLGSSTDSHGQSDGSNQSSADSLVSATISQTSHATAGASEEAGQPSLTHQVLSPILEAAQSMVNGGARTLRLQLQPENFGQINMQIVRGADGRVSAHMLAQFDVAHEALAKGMTSLRESMEMAGVSVGQLDVSLGHGNSARSGAEDSPGNPAATGVDIRQPAAAGVEALATGSADQPRLLSLRI
ncbi:MAG TPA: flagellar hook-length control protein FliK, partial [Blastocatellia bacterium]|nr:flagellar hook-length control protein FliK [Blastocatellia bacterium]